MNEIFIYYLIFIIVSSLVAILLHELGHRQVARHFGLQTEISRSLFFFGIVLMLASLVNTLYVALTLGHIILLSCAIPCGYKVLNEDKINYKVGLCKTAGPLVNLVVGAFILILSLNISKEIFPLNLFVADAALVFFMNGLFNMIPIGYLDGQEIFKWNKLVFLLLFSSLLTLMILTMVFTCLPIEINPYF